MLKHNIDDRPDISYLSLTWESPHLVMVDTIWRCTNSESTCNYNVYT